MRIVMEKKPMPRLMSYDFPEYYEIAFSFRNIPHEVDVMEECIRKYTKLSAKRILELACGPCPHMVEISKRGYHYTGIDINDNMLEYGRQKAASESIKADLRKASMIDFALDVKADFAFVALGSLYVTNRAEINMHFNSVANALNPGGLYLLDWCIQFSLDKIFGDSGESWETAHDKTKVKTTVKMRPVDFVEQLFEENLIMEVDDKGNHQLISSKYLKRVIFPQEFLSLVRHRTDFEFIGWWNEWDLSKPLSSVLNEINRPITLLRKT